MKMHKIMIFSMIMMNNLKEEIQAAMKKMNLMRNLIKSNILKTFWKKVASGASSQMLMKK